MDERGATVQRRFGLPMPTKPVGVIMDHAGRTCYVASLWARQISRVDLATGRTVATIDLDFAPRNTIALADGSTLVVADAFGGKLALVDTETDRVVRRSEIPGHNIRG